MMKTMNASAQRHDATSIFISTFIEVFTWIAPGEGPVATG